MSTEVLLSLLLFAQGPAATPKSCRDSYPLPHLDTALTIPPPDTAKSTTAMRILGGWAQDVVNYDWEDSLAKHLVDSLGADLEPTLLHIIRANGNSATAAGYFYAHLRLSDLALERILLAATLRGDSALMGLSFWTITWRETFGQPWLSPVRASLICQFAEAYLANATRPELVAKSTPMSLIHLEVERKQGSKEAAALLGTDELRRVSDALKRSH